jgi:cell division protein FtsL
MDKRDGNSSRREKRQEAKRLGILTDAQVAMGWFVILALAAWLGTIYLSQASRIAGTGRRVQILQNQLDELKRENAVLERSIAEAQSLERLQQEAIRLGFVRAAPEDIEYLVVEEYPAEQAAVPVPTPLPPQPVETIREAIWLTAGNSVIGLMYGEANR